MFHRKVRSKHRPVTPFVMEEKDDHFIIPQLAIREVHKNPDWKELITCVKKYCDATTLHGFKYLSEPNRPIYERIYWLIAIIIVYSAVAFIVSDQVDNYLKKPILIAFDSKPRSVMEIPFPAVTICSDNQIRSSMINLTKAFDDFQHLSPEMRKRFEYAVYICKFNHPGEQFDTFDPDFFYEMLASVFGNGTCADQILRLKWNSDILERPCQYLQSTTTSQGACFSFNMLPFSYIFRKPKTIFRNWSEGNWTDSTKMWSLDSGYIAGGGNYPDIPPWRTTGSNGVSFAFGIDTKDSEELCSRGGKGFSVYIHNPAELPSQADALFYLEENRDTTVSVFPQLYLTDDSLKKSSTQERGCYFQNERFLRFFQIYTQRNCEMECKANITLNTCECAPFYFPRKLNTTVCGSAKRDCVEQSIGHSGELCECLPSCSELQFGIRVNKAPRNLSIDLTHHSNETYTKLKVMFQANYFIGIKRTVMFGFSDFIANVGGILGLFLGFSILSLVEIVYFLFFRPCTNLRQRRRIKPLTNNMRKLNYGSLVVSSKLHRGSSQYPSTTLRNIRY